jgi:hypothetical protein
MLIEVLAVYLGMSIAIAYFAIKDDKILKGYNPNARDGDKDGILQEGTRWERKAK